MLCDLCRGTSPWVAQSPPRLGCTRLTKGASVLPWVARSPPRCPGLPRPANSQAGANVSNSSQRRTPPSMIIIHRGRSSGSPPASATGGAPSPLSDPARRPAHGSFRHASVLEAVQAPIAPRSAPPFVAAQNLGPSDPRRKCVAAEVCLCPSRLVSTQARLAHPTPWNRQTRPRKWSRTIHGAAWRAAAAVSGRQQPSSPPGQAFSAQSVPGTDVTEGLMGAQRVGDSRGSTAYAVNPSEATHGSPMGH